MSTNVPGLSVSTAPAPPPGLINNTTTDPTMTPVAPMANGPNQQAQAAPNNPMLAYGWPNSKYNRGWFAVDAAG